MDKLTAKQVRRLSADIAASDADYDVEFVGGTLTDFLNQLADALEAKEQAESRLKEAMRFIDNLFAKCHVVYFQPDGAYPIEHNPYAQKDNREAIERAFGVKVEEWKP